MLPLCCKLASWRLVGFLQVVSSMCRCLTGRIRSVTGRKSTGMDIPGFTIQKTGFHDSLTGKKLIFACSVTHLLCNSHVKTILHRYHLLT